MSDKLLPCPNPWTDTGQLKTSQGVCVAPPKVYWRYMMAGERLCRVECACGVVGPIRDTEAEAIAAWNLRPDDPRLAAAVEMAKALEDGRIFLLLLADPKVVEEKIAKLIHEQTALIDAALRAYRDAGGE